MDEHFQPATLERLLREPALSEAESLACHTRIKRGDTAAAGELVLGHVRWIAFLVRKATPRNPEQFEDFLAVALKASLRAAECWNPDEHGAFAPLLQLYIRGAIWTELRNQRHPVVLPRWWEEVRQSVKKTAQGLETTLHRAPTIDEVMAEINRFRQENRLIPFTRDRVELALAPLTRISLDETPRDDETGERRAERVLAQAVKGAPGDPDDVSSGCTACAETESVGGLLGRLEPRTQTILRMRFGFDGPPLDRPAIGRRLGLTGERVRQNESVGLKRLRAFAEQAVVPV
jgi:DNA-directed RNA polymerase specialized sigma subunit